MILIMYDAVVHESVRNDRFRDRFAVAPAIDGTHKTQHTQPVCMCGVSAVGAKKTPNEH